MKHVQAFRLLAIVCVLAMMSASCAKDAPTDAKKQFENNPPTITWEDDSAKEIESYAADVEVYTASNRSSEPAKLDDRYRISMKSINGTMCTRIDFDPAFNKGVARSVISDGTSMILFNTDTNEIEQRISIAGQTPESLRELSGETALSRINLSRVRDIARRLSFDLNEDAKENIMMVSLPSSLLNEKDRAMRVSTRVYFDTLQETLLSTEIIEKEADGTEITTTTQPMYAENNGVPVKVGDITIIDTKAPALVPGFDASTPIFNTVEDIPSVEQSAAEAMLTEGSATPLETVTLGNPADLSNVETVITKCTEVEINQVSDRLFRLLTEVK